MGQGGSDPNWYNLFVSQFSDMLCRFRERAGHPTARHFFKSAGGPAVFRCSYKQYLNIEGGRCVPRPRLVHALVMTLRLWEDPEKASLFSRAYLSTLIGSEELLDFLVRSLAQPAKAVGSASSLLRKALQRDLEARTLPLTVAQSRLLRQDDLHFWTFALLENDSGAWSPEQISRVVHFPLRRVRKALKDLEREKLVVGLNNDTYRCPHHKRVLIHERPVGRDRFEIAPHLPELRKRWDAMARKHGQALFEHYQFLRVSESEFKNYYPYLAQSVRASGVYSRTEKDADTALLVVEARVRRILPF